MKRSKITTVAKERVKYLRKHLKFQGGPQQGEWLGKKLQSKGKRRGMEVLLSDSSAPSVHQGFPTSALYWHSGLIHSLLWGAILCIVRYLSAPLASTYQMPVAHTALSPKLWQPRMSPNIAECPGIGGQGGECKIVSVENHCCTLFHLVLQCRDCGQALRDKMRCPRTHS